MQVSTPSPRLIYCSTRTGGKHYLKLLLLIQFIVLFSYFLPQLAFLEYTANFMNLWWCQRLLRFSVHHLGWAFSPATRTPVTNITELGCEFHLLSVLVACQCVLWKVGGGPCSSSWVFATHMGSLGLVLRSHLGPGVVLAI